MKRDKEVNARLEEMGWTVLRFWDDEINNNIQNCVQIVKKNLMTTIIAGED